MKPNPNYRSVPIAILRVDENGVELVMDSANAAQVEGLRIGKSQTPPELFWFGDHGKFRGFLQTDLVDTSNTPPSKAASLSPHDPA
jgi:hypothetical protein